MEKGKSGVPQLELVPDPGDGPSEDGTLAYFSGALTWYAKTEPDRLATVHEIAETVESCLEGVGIRVHVPHRDVDHSDGDRTYWQNRLTIARSDLVVAYYDLPSTGMGQELEIAAEYARPVVLLINERRAKVSTMVSTAFFRAEKLVYDDQVDLAAKLPALASEVIASGRSADALTPGLGSILAQRRLERGMSRATLAQMGSCSVELIRHLEDDDPSLLSPSLVQLERLVGALEIKVDALFGQGPKSVERRLLDFAARNGYSAQRALQAVEVAARDAEVDSEEQMAELFEALGYAEDEPS